MTPQSNIAIQNWLNNLAPSSQTVQATYFKRFLNWIPENGGKFATFTPDDLIEYQKEHRDFELLDKIIKPFVRQAAGTYNTKKNRYNNIRSFFAHNRAELPKDKQFKIRPEIAPVQGTLNAHEIKNAVLSSKPMYQAMILTMFQSAMDQEMITHWNSNGWDSLHEQLDQDIIKIELPGRKGARNIKPFYSFIGGDAVKAIKAWMQLRAEKVRQGKISVNNKVIFCNQYGEAISKASLRRYWTKRLRDIGSIPPHSPETKGRLTGKGLHEMRDVWRSLWSKSPASHTVGEYLMGHKIDKLEYDKSFRDVEFYREEYAKALPYLQLISSGAPFGRVEKNEIDSQNRRIKDLENKLEIALMDRDRATLLEERLDRLEKLIREKL